jgi:hypothetical protein
VTDATVAGSESTDATTSTGIGAAPLAALAILAGAAVAVLVGVYAQVHDPTGEATITMFFTSTLHFKAWAATVVLLFALFQLFSALWMYGRLGWSVPSWLGSAHRLSGTLALLVSLPVVFHCLWSLGFETDTGETRRFLHSLFGCLVYGAFTTKILSVRLHGMPKWMLPAVGGALFAALVGVWLTSSLWFFQTFGFEV